VLFQHSVDAAVTVHDMDVMAELTGMDLLRVMVVATHAPTTGHWNHYRCGLTAEVSRGASPTPEQEGLLVLSSLLLPLGSGEVICVKYRSRHRGEGFLYMGILIP
jgi:hypothetical protein